ncbi:C40 family peptidase [Cedecea davisae]|uniref:C40 family peptidase n=1 Tax=Cedecea davisae TaxID=158484 RepID=UPI00376F3A44
MLISISTSIVSTFPPASELSRRMAGFFFLLLMVLFSTQVFAAPVKHKPAQSRAQTQNKEARERMKNRAKLLAKAKKRVAVVPLTPEQRIRQAAEKLASRSWNRQQLAMHARWRPGYFGGSERLLPLATESLMAEMVSPRVEETIYKVIHRLKQQLGKPYVWGGQTPDQGFDCSGLIYYAYNQLLSRKLPRTANGMFQDSKLKRVNQQQLQRGDLVFFSIKSQDKADHVGVYLGDGQFIEAPRTGLNIRISQLTDNYWQDHYLGAKRILTEEAIL